MVYIRMKKTLLSLKYGDVGELWAEIKIIKNVSCLDRLTAEKVPRMPVPLLVA